MVYYSANLNGFIPAAWKDDGTYNKKTWPSDAVLLSDEESNEYWKTTPPDRKTIGSLNGRPVWVDIPPPSPEELIYRAVQKKKALREAADSEIAWRQDAVDMGDATEKEKADLTEWRKYRVLLMRVDVSTAPNIEWPLKPE
ncbi:hypothetical protein PL78_19250 [Yersinia entomophaga]|uniref:Tail fiber assembly protein n=1 Tax=Yersinia entomophaga TaxID=935293 RepID=A0ABM6BR49_YERET|nr:tail fiber assembly protein [Yersinia entomophaga]ANI28921.1 hypothetical protein PL78_03580 [Yersinia entomophaga]ANI31951.1 hypothetical protein PL78_19250 [Yersinia entomophaga]